MPKIYLPVIANDTPPYYGLAMAEAHPEDLASLGVGWWYDWTPTGGVPMLWGGNASASIPADYRGDILFLNEPNVATQSNLTPQQAAAKFAVVRAAYPRARLTFDPTDIYQFTDHPYEGGYLGTKPIDFTVNIYAEQSDALCNGTSNTDPVTGDVSTNINNLIIFSNEIIIR